MTTAKLPAAGLKKRLNGGIGLTVVLFMIAIVCVLFPLYIAVVVAVKSPDQMANVLSFPTKLRLQNFADAIKMTNFGNALKNTLVITILSLAGTILTNSFVAYAIQRNMGKSKFFRGMYYYLVSAMFIPFNVIMLPMVKQTSFLHLDNVFGLVVLYIVFGLPMNVFLYTGYLKSVPVSLDEAATIDGADTWKIFFHIILPMMKPITATVSILTFLWTWNDFMMPLVLLSDPNQQTLQLAQYVFQGQFSTNYNLAFASYLLVLLPIVVVYLIMQKGIVNGITAGAVKG